MSEIIFKDFTVDNLFDFCGVLDAVGAEEVFSAFDEREIKALQRQETRYVCFCQTVLCLMTGRTPRLMIFAI